ncbi:MAG: BON domain-containing protein [Gammaproteobacteria bacterium]|nr:BON domain-containing protein [Gammaproteobacteria bacterium]
MQKLLLASIISSTFMISGCAGLLFGGAVVGGVAAATTLHDRRTPGRVIDDKNLELIISKKIVNNKYIDYNSHTNLTVYNGVVLVTGEALNQKVIDSIINIVKSSPNVKRVENDMAIMMKSSLLSRSNDSAITTKVKTALLSLKLPNFDPSLINVSTERGKVYIMGLVTETEAQAIVEKSRRVSGVRSITKVFEYLNH